jgi:hypothetical protein
MKDFCLVLILNWDEKEMYIALCGKYKRQYPRWTGELEEFVRKIAISKRPELFYKQVLWLV